MSRSRKPRADSRVSPQLVLSLISLGKAARELTHSRYIVDWVHEVVIDTILDPKLTEREAVGTFKEITELMHMTKKVGRV